ncbi:MAG: mandelate racemase/muconate lactonizing enzyme family protein [Trueperaceae bacterium]
MKIVDMQTTLVSRPLAEYVGSGHLYPPTARDILFLRVDTDAGVSGTGFITGLGFVDGSEIRVIRQIVDTALKHLVMGEDPAFTEWIWDKMFRGTIRFGRKGAVLRAISLVDIALWDLKGHVYEAPLWELLGGHKREVPVYGSGGHYQAGEKGHEKLRAEVQELLDVGFRGIKMKVGGRSPYEDFERTAAMREAIGPGVDLMVDANEGWTVHQAIQFAKLAEPLHLAWIEEPVANDNLEGYRRIAESTATPLAAGENEYTRYGFYQLIHQGGILVCQVDVTRVGGVSEWMKVANLASAVGIPVIPHGVHELHVQLAAASSAVPMLEFFPSNSPIQSFITECISGPDTVKQVSGGTMQVPIGHGFGLSYDAEVIDRYRTD